jgi:single-strand DNA-binding protein
MNVITITGAITRDAELRSTSGGESVAKFSVADQAFSKGDNKQVIFWNCDLWGKRGEALHSYLVKGTKVTIVGKIAQREYNDKDGVLKKAMTVRVDEVVLQGSKSEQQEDRPAQSKPQNATAKTGGGSGFDDMEDDIPF